MNGVLGTLRVDLAGFAGFAGLVLLNSARPRNGLNTLRSQVVGVFIRGRENQPRKPRKPRSRWIR